MWKDQFRGVSKNLSNGQRLPELGCEKFRNTEFGLHLVLTHGARS